ncbi:MAG: crossover junction endodeoxyribonuclease RuvC [Candidatus Zixiibacteriota bacterium]|nr:MAG: crossover junction endodeoxyribonuclease RuvC [candidate division Zixibacteria bacterium]
MIIIGIDPGLQITGYGVLESDSIKVRVLEAGIIKTNANDRFEDKLNEIFSEVGKVIKQYKPDYIAVEELYSHYAHPKTAIIMGHARGTVFLQASQSKTPIASYAATRIKKSLTGNGRASKSQMRKMIKSTLNLKDELFSPDTADALAAAVCHHNTLLKGSG